jgi:hypothetical protein
MRIINILTLTAVAVVLAVVPVMAGDGTTGKPTVTGTDKAVQEINAATSKQLEILTGLLSKVPAQAQPGIQKAINAAQQGHASAIAAITGHDGSGDNGSQDITTAEHGPTTEAAGKPDVTGLERAKAAVSAGFDKSIATLQGLLDTVPDKATSPVGAALNRLDSTRTVALQNLDNLIAGQKPDHQAALDHAGRPEAPARPDRPDHPERPQVPVRPERPQVPDHPSPHG